MMVRERILELAAQGHRFPVGTDLTLHGHADAPAIMHDGARLGAVLAENADCWGTPLAIPLMDLMLEKTAMLLAMGVPEADVATFHFHDEVAADYLKAFDANAPTMFDATPRLRANMGAVRWVVQERKDLIACAMTIGPFSLATKLLSDPITPVYMAGMGDEAEDNEEVALFEQVLDISRRVVLASVRQQLADGAAAVFVAEPAANLVFFSPKQLAAGADVFERYAMQPNRELAQLVRESGAELLFHCCGELVDSMVRDFASLHPALLSLGSSRCLWHDAALVPKNVVLYGNLPSKKFLNDDMPPALVRTMAAELSEQMAQTGHPFILGTECDVLSVPTARDAIQAKVDAMMA